MTDQMQAPAAVTGAPRFGLVYRSEAGREAGVRTVLWGAPGAAVAVGHCYRVDPGLRAPDGPWLHAVLLEGRYGADVLAGDDAELLAKLNARLAEKGPWWK